MTLVWFDGGIVNDGAISLSPRDRALTLGDGLFETILVVNHVALWRGEHLARMRASAAVLGISFPEREIDEAMTGLLTAGGSATHVLRLTLMRGATDRGLAGEAGPTGVLATLDPFDHALTGRSAKLATSAIRRNAASVTATHKTLSYADNVAAARQAAHVGADDAIMLNTDGHVASSTIANIFALSGTKLVTPALDQAILPGIMRGVLLKEAAGIGLQPVETALTQRQLAEADAVFLTNSLRLVRPVTAIDGQSCTANSVQKILDRLCILAKAQCGIDPRRH